MDIDQELIQENNEALHTEMSFSHKTNKAQTTNSPYILVTTLNQTIARAPNTNQINLKDPHLIKLDDKELNHNQLRTIAPNLSHPVVHVQNPNQTNAQMPNSNQIAAQATNTNQIKNQDPNNRATNVNTTQIQSREINTQSKRQKYITQTKKPSDKGSLNAETDQKKN